jgi:hypothetical protein
LRRSEEKAALDVVDIGDAIVLSGALIGAMLPFLFAALTMLSVQKVSLDPNVQIALYHCSQLLCFLIEGCWGYHH